MINKSYFFILLFLIVSCHTNKSVIQTTKRSSTATKVSKKTIEKKASVYTPKTETLEAKSKIKVTTEMIMTYINNYKTVAQSNMKKYGIPASIILGQALLESGSGTGSLCVQANNHFGIKCSSDWSGESVTHNDDAANECFRKYKNPYDSFGDHAVFLTAKKRYAALFNLDKTDYKSWATGLKDAGYATDPQYPAKLITLIEKYQLYQYDNVLANLSYNNDSNSSKTKLISREHFVTKGDTLYSISKKYDVPIEDLKRNNNILENEIAIGQSILILK